MGKNNYPKINRTLESKVKLNNKKNTKTKIIKDGIGSLIVNISNKALMLFSGILLVRFLGKEAFGVYSYILSLILVLITPLEFGISNLVVRETSARITKNQPERINGIWRWSIRTIIVFSTFLILLLILSSIFVGHKFTKLEMETLYWALGLIPLLSIIHLISAALRGLNYVVLGQLPDLIIIPSLYIILILLFDFTSYANFSSTMAMAIRLIVTFVTFIICVILFYLKTPKHILTTKPIRDDRIWFASAIPLSLSSGLNMVKARTTILIIGIFVTAGEIGTYQIAVSAASVAGLVLQAANAFLAPQFASLYAKGDKNNLQKLIIISARIIAFSSLFATIVFIFWGKPLLQFAFGIELVDAYSSTLILLVGQLVNSLVGSVVILLNMTGFEKDVMKVITISSLLNIILTLVLSAFWGINGAAVSNSITLILAQFLLYRIVREKLGIVSHAFGKIPK